MRDVYPVKYFSKQGFIETTVEIVDEDLQAIIEDYLAQRMDFDEMELVNNRPMNIWLHAKCRTYVEPDDERICDAEVEIKGN